MSGNKADLKKRYDINGGFETILKNGTEYFGFEKSYETSAKTGKNVHALFSKAAEIILRGNKCCGCCCCC